MRVNTVSIFSDGEAFYAHADYEGGDLWSVTLYINSSQSNKWLGSSLHLFMSLDKFIVFKNSVLSSFNKVMKEAGYDR